MKTYTTVYLKILLLICILSYLPTESFAQMRGGGGNRGMGGNTGGSSSMYQRYYQTNGMIGEAIIEADYDSRSIIVITDEDTNEYIGEIIKNLDRPVPQVLIKVVFLEVTYRDDSDLGIEAALELNSDPQNSNLFQTAFGLAAESRGGFYQLLEDDLNVTMRAIAEVGKTEILSRPSILTRNNQEAYITVGKEVPFINSSRITDDGQTINTVIYEDIGIMLTVTPFITQEGLVEMMLSPEISTITDETVPISDTVNSPVFAKRAADTVVVTPNGKTVVIGGMMEDNITETTTKIPFLGDIPLLGMAFKRNVKKKSKTELLIFLTPYVVEGPSQLVERSKIEHRQSELAPKAFTNDQLEKYLGELQSSNVTEPVPVLDNTVKQSAQPAKIKTIEEKKTKRARNSKGKPIKY